LGVSVDGNEGSVQTENDPWLKRTADEIRQGALDRARKSLVVSWLTKPPYEAELFQNHRDSLRELLRLSPEEMFRFGVTLDRVHGGMKIVELQAYGQNGPRWENVVEFSPVRE